MKILANFTAAAESFHLSGGCPELQSVDNILAWSFHKNFPDSTVKVELPAAPSDCSCVQITLELLTDRAGAAAADVFSSEIVQGQNVIKTAPAISFVGGNSAEFRRITFECCLINADSIEPLQLLITRCTEDNADTFQGASALKSISVDFLHIDNDSFTVADFPGYNSWPMCQTVGEKIVCAYSRGNGHDIFDANRAVYVRTSSDGGQHWEPETLVCNTPGRGDVAIGKGLDEKGNMLLWVRHAGEDGFRHRLYRSADGQNFECLCNNMDLPLNTMQITDIFHVPGVGLMALFFGGPLGIPHDKYWGKLTSSDNGYTWESVIIEKDLPTRQWPTEPSAAYLGNGRILAVSRIEIGDKSTARAQFQLTSTDYGRTWHKEPTNITDVNISTPSIIYDPESGRLSCYYFYRGRGVLNRRVADAEYIFDHPRHWPAPETVAIGSCEVCEAGNVNVVGYGQCHALAYYSGSLPDTAVYIKLIRVC